MSVVVRTYGSLDALGRAASDEFAAVCRRAIAERGAAYVALSGGATPRALYEHLTVDGLEWPKVELFWSDERAVAATSPDSNYRLAKELLLDRVAPKAVHRLRGEAADLSVEAERYERLIRARAPNHAFDLIVLGLGSDGHTASLFPHSAALEESARLVALNHVAGRGHRLTFTLPLIGAARQLLFMVAGADKSRAVRELLGGGDAGELPAQRVRAEQVLWLLDADAARELTDAFPA